MAGQNSLILATDYNSIQSKVALVLGAGSGTLGYGQTVLSSQVANRTNITVAQWANLKADLLKARQYQTGNDLVSSLTLPTRTTGITESDRLAYAQMADEITLLSNRIKKPIPTQATRSALIPIQQRTSAWNGIITHVITVTFPNADAARYFFNTGSQFEFSAERFGGANSSKNNTWTSMFSQPPSSGMGVISFNYNSTTNTGTGVPSTSIGWYQLLQDDQLIFQKNAPTGDYADNKYYIFAKRPQPNVIVFTIRFQDSAGVALIDEDVDGTLNSIVEVYRASGNNVSVPLPSGSTSGIGGGLAPVISISPITIPDIQVGTASLNTFTTSGGASPYTYTYTGNIPPGFTLTESGVLSGTPITNGTYTFYITSTDSNNYTASRSYTITASSRTIELSPTTILNPSLTVAYSTNISASGGSAPYIFSSVSALPPGLTLTTGGVLAGTPTVAGSYNFTITATDSQGYTGSQAYTVVIPPRLAAIFPTTFTGTEVNPLSIVFGVTGGIGPYTFSPTGAFPAGTSFSSLSGVTTVTLSGTPTANATNTGTFQLNVSDTTGQTLLGAVTWSIAVRPALTLGIVKAASYLTGVAVGGLYLTASGGTSPYTYTITSGTLPTGLTLTSNGTFSGAPSSVGDSNFTARATDFTGLVGTGSFSLTTVAPPPPPAAPSISISPTTSSQTIARTTAAQTTTGSFTVTCNSNNGVVQITNPTKPAGSTVTITPLSFYLATGGSQQVDFSVTSPAAYPNTVDSLTYTIQSVIQGGSGSVSHTHTQARLAAPPPPPPTPPAVHGTASFLYGSSTQSWIVPQGVTLVNVVMAGAGGGGGGNDRLQGADGYPGDQYSGPVAVTPGDVLTFSVGARGRRGMPSTGAGAGIGGPAQIAGGGPGGPGGVAGAVGVSGGGGGGGAATVLTLNGTMFAVACGGGGGGGGGNYSPGQYLTAESYVEGVAGSGGENKGGSDGAGGGGGGGGVQGGAGGPCRDGDNGAFCGSRGKSSTLPAGWIRSNPTKGTYGAATGGNGGLAGIQGVREPGDGGDGYLDLVW